MSASRAAPHFEPPPADGGAAWRAVYAPATVANVGPGFDCFGFALERPGDVVYARPTTDDAGVRITGIDGDDGLLPRDVDRNTAGVAASSIWRRYAEATAGAGLELRIAKGLPAGSGLGSSSASAVAGALAAVTILHETSGIAVRSDEIISAALDGEEVASGSRHADNVAPAVLGGFTIVESVDPLHVARFEPTLACVVAVVTPRFAMPTREARQELPTLVPLTAAVGNWSRAAALVLGLVRSDRAMVARSLVDEIVEPHRARRIPGCESARAAAREAGAFACAVSGAGPTLFALADSEGDARSAADAIAVVFADHGLTSATWTSRISERGAQVL